MTFNIISIFNITNVTIAQPCIKKDSHYTTKKRSLYLRRAKTCLMEEEISQALIRRRARLIKASIFCADEHIQQIFLSLPVKFQP